MATIQRVRVVWSSVGVTGGGLSTFYFDTPNAGFPADVLTFFTDIATRFPDDVQWTVPSSGDELDSATGAITGTWTDNTGGTVAGTVAGGNYAAGVGARVVWDTNGRTNNRRVRGSTFLCPLSNAAYASNGEIDPSVIVDLEAAADALRIAQSGSLVVWTRPVGGTGGALNSVLAVDVPNQVTWLRSRRT